MKLRGGFSDAVDYGVVLLILIALASAVFGFSRMGDNFLLATKVNSFFVCIGFLSASLAVRLLIHLFKNPFVKLNISLVDGLLVVWLVYVSMSTYYSQHSLITDKFLIFFAVILLYFGLRGLLDSEGAQDIRLTILKGLLFIAGFETLVGIFQLFGFMESLSSDFGLTGTFKNPAPFALYIAASFPLALFVFLFYRQQSMRVLSILNMLIMLPVLAATQNRASWLALTIVIIGLLVIRYQILSRTWIKLGKSTAKIVLLFVLLSVLTALIAVYMFKFKPKSADGRLLIWEITIDKAKGSFFVGKGFGSFRADYNKWQVDYFREHPHVLDKRYLGDSSVGEFAGYIKMAYNEFIEILVEQGIIGLLLFLSIVTIAFYYVAKRGINDKSDELLAYLAGLTVLLIAAIFSYPLYSLPTLVLFFVFLALVSNGSLSTSPIKMSETGSKIFKGIAAIVLLVLSFSFIELGVKRFQLYNRYLKARVISNFNLSAAEYEYQTLVTDLHHDPDFLVDYSKCLIGVGNLKYAQQLLMRASKMDTNPLIHIMNGNIMKDWKKYDEAEKSYQTAALIMPGRLYPKYLLFKLYLVSENKAKAIAIATVINGIDPKIKTSQSDQILREARLYLGK